MVVHGDKLRWLFWLRWKMFLRGFTRKATARIIGTVFMLLFILIGGGGLAIATFFGYRFLPSPVNAELLFLVLSGLYLIWIVLPLLEVGVNEGLDVSKLSLFPLTRGELMLSLLFSTLLDLPMLALLFLFAAVVAGWAISLPVALMALLSMIVFYVQLVGISQLVLALLQPVLNSRRFRDLSVILSVLLVSLVYLCQLAARSFFSTGFATLMQQGRFSPYLQWLPPGMAARVVQEASVGNWGLSVIWLVALIVVSVVVLFLWQLLVERGLTAAESGGTVKAVKSRRQGSTAIEAPTPAFERLLPPQVVALLNKDIKYMMRDPQIKALFLQSLISLAFLLVITFVDLNNGKVGRNIGPWAVMFGPAFVLFSLFSLTYNVLGIERQALTTLFLFPVEPKYILWSKNILVFAIGFVEVVLIALIEAFLTHAWDFILPGIVVGLTGVGIIIGLGNFTSVFFPQQMRFGRRGFQTAANMSASGGCLRGLMTAISFYGTLIVMIPVALGLILPYANGATWIWSLTIPASLLYSAIIYTVITLLVTPRILNKAPEILNAIVKE